MDMSMPEDHFMKPFYHKPIEGLPFDAPMQSPKVLNQQKEPSYYNYLEDFGNPFNENYVNEDTGLKTSFDACFNTASIESKGHSSEDDCLPSRMISQFSVLRNKSDDVEGPSNRLMKLDGAILEAS